MARGYQPPSTSPNKVLVIFLVIFILTTLSGATWVYVQGKDKDKWDTAAKEKAVEVQREKQTAEWFKYQRDELLAAIGEPEFNKKAEALKNWKDKRELFLKQGGFANEEGDKEFRDFVTKYLEPKLDGFSDGYKLKFGELREPLEGKVSKLQQDYATVVRKNKEQEQKLLDLDAQHKKDREKVVSEFKAENDKTMEARAKATEEMKKIIAQNEDLVKKFEDIDQLAKKELASRDSRIAMLEDKINRQEAIAKSPNRTSSDPHALVLDVSRGKPLWDMARGKVTRVIDGSAKKVIIDRGSRDGIKPGLTFAVFTGGWNGRGQGDVKATIEVVRVEDATTSICKVNSFYDSDGHEIPVTEATGDRILRDAGNAIREGDMLFNAVWGTHVAIVGIVELPGSTAKGPAGQMDDLMSFMHQLEQIGVSVDAYTDLRDGKMVGELTPNTNMLIRGKLAPKFADAGDDTRVKAINETIAAMRSEAIERGMFVISPQNFEVICGMRRLGSDGIVQTLPFVPSRPAGGPVTEPPAGAPMQKKGL